MDVRIGVTYTAKELDIELEEGADPESVQSDIDAAMSGSTAMLWLTDRKGRRVGIPTEKLAFVEIGSPDAERRIGFGA